jgi:hypothetical protein
MGGQQPRRIPRKPRDHSKSKHLKIITRLISIYKRLSLLDLESSDLGLYKINFRSRKIDL